MAGGSELFGDVYERGATIVRQGERGDVMYVIQSGAAEVTQSDGESVRVLTVLEQGDFFGEVALFGADTRTATVTALQPTRVLALAASTLLERIGSDPGIALHLLAGLSRKIQRAHKRLSAAVESDDDLRAALSAHQEARRGQEPPDYSGAPAAPAAPAAPGLAVAPETGVGTGAGAIGLTGSAPGDASAASAPELEPIADSELAAAWDVGGAPQWYEPGQVVFPEGEPGDAMYVVVEGNVEISRRDGAAVRVLAQVGPRDFFGETALITSGARTAAATATVRTQLIPVTRAEFLERVKSHPDFAVFLLRVLVGRLRRAEAALRNPEATLETVGQALPPLTVKDQRLRVTILALSTCGGCSAVFLDDTTLASLVERVDVVYCPMLMDHEEIPEADIALVDGAARLREDREKLELARARSRFLVAWGTCAAFGGIPAMANRFELEDLIEEAYGEAHDPMAYYLSGQAGVETATYQETGVTALRQTHKLDDLVRVDYYVPGCPPPKSFLFALLDELAGRKVDAPKAVVCGECPRKPQRTQVSELRLYPGATDDPAACFISQGALCMGFLTKGGCGGNCARNGLPCWGCRGPSKGALKQLEAGDTFEEAVLGGLAPRCHADVGTLKPGVKLLRKEGHSLFSFERNFVTKMARIR